MKSVRVKIVVVVVPVASDIHAHAVHWAPVNALKAGHVHIGKVVTLKNKM